MPISVKVTVTANNTTTKDIKLVNKTGMVAWYSFDGNANDVSGNGKDGTIVGSPSLTTDHLGRSNHAYLFNMGLVHQLL